MPLAKEAKIYKKFMVSISLAVALCLAGVFLAISLRTRNLIQDEIVTNARSHVESIVLVRKWNAGYGGVYVEKKEGVESNPYLKGRDIRTVDGKVYTLRNPAMMTREISEYARKGGNFSFHITSRNLMNPKNAPDAFEKKALALFEKGEKEVFETEILNGKTLFRYMAPLITEEACLPCHAEQGYTTGDVRGGISVTFDIGAIQEKMRKNTSMITFFGVSSTFLLLILLWYFTKRLISRVSDAREYIEKIAITDELTGIYNRRHLLIRFGEEFERARRLGTSLGCIMLDIDHFKVVNDTLGHLAGDEVLKKVAQLTRDLIRIYDVLGRIGGEEFLIILPDTSFNDSSVLAGRIRQEIEKHFALHPDGPNVHGITVSLGVTSIREHDVSIDDMIKRADQGLYKAKNGGRNQVGWTDIPTVS